MADCNADTQANDLFTSLTTDAPSTPTIDFTGSDYTYTKDSTSTLYADISGIVLADLTECDLDGDGVFDKLMVSVDLHIAREFKNNRITGDQYAEVYTSLVNSVLNQSTQFLLTRDQAKWAAIAAQMEARSAEIKATEAVVSLEKTKIEAQIALAQMKDVTAQYGLTKMRIANEDANYCLTTAKTDTEVYTSGTLLPSQVAMNDVQSGRILPAEASYKEFEVSDIQPIEKDTAAYNLASILPAQKALVDEQIEAAHAQVSDTLTDGVTDVVGLLGRQRTLLDEKYETERAQTVDTRSNGSNIVGSIGKQKELYTQQIDAYVKDAEYKAGKMYLDAWITQKTLDDGLAAPDELTNTTINTVLNKVRLNNGLI